MKDSYKKKQVVFARSLVPFLVLFLLMLLTFFAFYITYQNEQNVYETRFDNRTIEVLNLIEQRFTNYNQILVGGVGLFNASEDVARTEFSNYLKDQDIQENFPGIQGVGYSMVVGDKDQLQEHIELMKEDYPEYTFKPIADRDEYHAIVYLEPLDIRNKQAVGYDMYSQETRREAMSKARKTGESYLSGKVTLVQEIDEDIQSGFLLYAPQYRNMNDETLDQRIENLEGFVYSPFRMNDFMNGLLIDSELNSIDFVIYDQEINKDNLMYSHSQANKLAEQDRVPRFQRTKELTIFGRKWVIVFSERESFFENKLDLALVFLGSGMTISLLIFFVLLFYNGFMNRAADLNSVIDSVSKGEFDKKINPKLLHSRDELGTLARSFERILVSLKLAMRETKPKSKENSIDN